LGRKDNSAEAMNAAPKLAGQLLAKKVGLYLKNP